MSQEDNSRFNTRRTPMITLGEDSTPESVHCNCAPGFSACAKRAIKTNLGKQGGCPDGTKCVSLHLVQNADKGRANSFLSDSAHALRYIGERSWKRSRPHGATSWDLIKAKAACAAFFFVFKIFWKNVVECILYFHLFDGNIYNTTKEKIMHLCAKRSALSRLCTHCISALIKAKAISDFHRNDCHRRCKK